MKKSERVLGSSVLFPEDRGLEGALATAQPQNSAPSSTSFEGLKPAPASSSQTGTTSNHIISEKRRKDYLLYVQYTSNQSEIFASLRNTVTECTHKILVKKCSCGRTLLPQTCMKLNCINCVSWLSYRRARSAMRRILKYHPATHQRYFVPNVIYTVFTMPMELRQKYSDKKTIRKLRSEIWTILKEKYGALFALEGTHPIAENHPDVFHPHLNFLWIQKPGHRAFIDVEVLKEIYGKIIGYVGKPDVYTQYSKDLPQIWKWAQYVTRVFPSMSKWAGAIKWYGKFPKSDQKGAYTCPECGEHIFVLGYLNMYVYKSFEEHGWKVGHDPPWENDNYITPFKRKKDTA